MKAMTMQHDTVILRPLIEADIEPLVRIAESDGLCDLWYTSVPNRERAAAYFDKAFSDRDAGVAFPFAVVLKETGEVIGSTRFYDYREVHKNVLLGYTWYAKKCQRTAVNTESKMLMLGYAFETLDCIAVSLETHHLNLRSQQAMQRLGAKQDGILRNHQILPDGSVRDTVRFSILSHDWEAIKINLENKLKQYQ